MSNPLEDLQFVKAYGFLFEHVLNRPIKYLNPEYKGNELLSEKDFTWYLTALLHSKTGENLFFYGAEKIAKKYRRESRAIKASWQKLTDAKLLIPKAFRLRNHLLDSEMNFSTHDEAVAFQLKNEDWGFSTTKFEVITPEKIFARLKLVSRPRKTEHGIRPPSNHKPNNYNSRGRRNYLNNEQSSWNGSHSIGKPKATDFSLTNKEK